MLLLSMMESLCCFSITNARRISQEVFFNVIILLWLEGLFCVMLILAGLFIVWSIFNAVITLIWPTGLFNIVIILLWPEGFFSVITLMGLGDLFYEVITLMESEESVVNPFPACYSFFHNKLGICCFNRDAYKSFMANLKSSLSTFKSQFKSQVHESIFKSSPSQVSGLWVKTSRMTRLEANYYSIHKGFCKVTLYIIYSSLYQVPKQQFTHFFYVKQ